MDTKEKLIDAGKIVNNATWVFFALILYISVYLLQRTIKFIHDEKLFTGGQEYMQEQFKGQLGFFTLEFSYGTMNVGWIWILGLMLVVLTALIRKRNDIYTALQKELETEPQKRINFFLPFDFFHSDYKSSLIAVVTLPLVIVFMDAILSAFVIAKHFWLEFRYIESILIFLGSIYTFIALIKLINMLRKSHNSE